VDGNYISDVGDLSWERADFVVCCSWRSMWREARDPKRALRRRRRATRTGYLSHLDVVTAFIEPSVGVDGEYALIDGFGNFSPTFPWHPISCGIVNACPKGISRPQNRGAWRRRQVCDFARRIQTQHVITLVNTATRCQELANVPRIRP